jgi:hypothetical protein
MRVWPVGAGRLGWVCVLMDRIVRNPAPRDEAPLRTVFNSMTGEFEEMSLPKFQQLLQRGEIQETISRRPDHSERRVYRLV